MQRAQRIKLSSTFNPLPNDKFSLAYSELKAFAKFYNKLKVAEMIFVSDRIENTQGKEENAGGQDFLLFPGCFQKLVTLGWVD